MGRPSPTGRTRWSSRRPGRARRSRRSCGPSTSSPPPEPPRRRRRAPGCSTSRRSRRWPSTSSATSARPLTGITRVAERLGLPAPQISVGVRSGDTPPARSARADHQAARHPHHHARVAVPDADVGGPRDPRRGAHGDRRRGARRRGHQARRPPGAVAGAARRSCWRRPHSASGCRRPSGPPRRSPGSSAEQHPPPSSRRRRGKTFDLSVAGAGARHGQPRRTTPIWPDVEDRIVDLIESHNSTIVFANSRRLAERLTARLNEIHAERIGSRAAATTPTRRSAAAPPRRSWAAARRYGAEPLLAQAPTTARSARSSAPSSRTTSRAGGCKAVVATSSLELGIDMGAVDLVIQVEAPPSVASGLQRIGRAGHQVGEISRGRAVPQAPHRPDRLRGHRAAHARRADRDHAGARPTRSTCSPSTPSPRAALEPLDADRWFDAVRRSAPFATLPRSAFEATLDLLSGKYPSDRVRRAAAAAGLRPRRGHADRPARRPATGGDLRRRHPRPRPVHRLPGVDADSEKPSRVGELDEEMVYESRPGDVISLGATSWRITEITHDRVLVIPAPRPAGPAAVLARRRRRAARRAGRGDRRVHRRAGRTGAR